MMPCKKCSGVDDQGRLLPHDRDGKPLRGLKQVRKTKLDGAKGERLYKCQDCGALETLTFDAQLGTHGTHSGGRDS